MEYTYYNQGFQHRSKFRMFIMTNLFLAVADPGDVGSTGSAGLIDLNLDERVSFTDAGTLLGNIIIAAMVIAGLMVFFYLIMGGIQYISSGGDKAQAEAARNRITYALIGLVIVVGSFAIIKLVESFFGLSILNPKLPEQALKIGI